MKRIFGSIICLLAMCWQVDAAILVFSPNGDPVQSSSAATLLGAATSLDCAGKTIVVTSALSAVQSNISSAAIHSWPPDRELKVVYGGSINPTTKFTGLKEAQPEWFGAKADNITDDTLAWQLAVTAASKIVANGQYQINATRLLTIPGAARCGINVPSNREIILGAMTKLSVITTATNNYAIFGSYGTSNVTIRGGELVGDKATHIGVTSASQYGFGVDFRDVTNGKVIDSYLHDFQGDGIYLGAGATGVKCDGIIIDKVISDANYRQGLSIVLADNVTVTSSTFSNTGGLTTGAKAGIDIESNSDAVYQSNIIIDDCRFIGNVGSGVDIFRGHDVSVTNSYFGGNGYGHSIRGSAAGASSTGVIIRGNKYIGNTNQAFDLQDNIGTLIIDGNYIEHTSTPGTGVAAYSVQPTTTALIKMLNNHFVCGASAGYCITWGVSDALSDWDISGNTFELYNGVNGMTFAGRNLKFNNNTVYVESGGLTGTSLIFFEGSGKTRLSGNSFFNNSGSPYNITAPLISTGPDVYRDIVMYRDNQLSLDILNDNINKLIPTSGYFQVGETVPNWSTTGIQWKRLTQGSAQVSGVDWLVQ